MELLEDGELYPMPIFITYKYYYQSNCIHKNMMDLVHSGDWKYTQYFEKLNEETYWII